MSYNNPSNWVLLSLLDLTFCTFWVFPLIFVWPPPQIVLFQFGLGANAYYVILELYAQGNVILADSDFMVMTLLRSHRLVFNIHFVCHFSNKS